MKLRLKSKTNWFGAAIAVLGVAQANFPMIQAQLGDNAGYVYIAIGGIIVILREITKDPVK